MVALAPAVSVAGVRVRADGVRQITARRPDRVVVRLADAASVTRILIGAVAPEGKTACRSRRFQFVRTDVAEAEVVRAGVSVFAVNGAATLDTRTVAAHLTRTAIVIVTAFGTGVATTQLTDAAIRVRATLVTRPVAAHLTDAAIRVLAARGAGVVAAAQFARAAIRVLAACPAGHVATHFVEITVGIRKTAYADVIDLVAHQAGWAGHRTFEHTDAARTDIRTIAERPVVTRETIGPVVDQTDAAAVARVRVITVIRSRIAAGRAGDLGIEQADSASIARVRIIAVVCGWITASSSRNARRVRAGPAAQADVVRAVISIVTIRVVAALDAVSVAAELIDSTFRIREAINADVARFVAEQRR